MPESQSQAVALAVRAATEWMEAVTGRRFPADRTFRAMLEDGTVLCEMMEILSPGILQATDHLDHVQRFLVACKDLGLSEEQLFDERDLQEASPTDISRRKSLNEKLKSVCLTLFWLSQISEYSGARLDLTPFAPLFPDQQVPAGDGLTVEEEQTADELLADIQSAVDEMLHDFQATSLSPDSNSPPTSFPPSSHTSSVDNPRHQLSAIDGEREPVVVEMEVTSGGFGFQVRGGLDTVMRAQVDMVLPGSAAEGGGVRAGDEIISVNGRDVTALKHADLVSAIRQAGSEGHISLGLLRVVEERPSKPLPPQEEQSRHAAALKRMYPKSHQFLDSQLAGSALPPVLEEELDLSPPLPPLPGEEVQPLPPLPGESSPLGLLPGDLQASPYISPLPPLPGEQNISELPPLPGEQNTSELPPLPGEQNTSELPPLPGEQNTSELPLELAVISELPLELAVIVSVRDSVREMEQLQMSMEPLSPPAPEVGEELTSEDLKVMVEGLGVSHTSERGEGEGEEQKEDEQVVQEVRNQPWEPKAQWEDSRVRVREDESRGDVRKAKIWSFLEEKTRVSNEERAQASKPSPQTTTPVFRKPPPPKVLPKPVRKKSVEQQTPAIGSSVAHEEEVFVPSPDPNMITIQSTSSAEPLNVRPVMAEEVELHGDIKIQRVARTRWTPQKKSTEQVQRSNSTPLQTPPTEVPPPLPTQQDTTRYGGTPPTGPVKQASLPLFPPRSLQSRGQSSRGQRFAEQTRVVPVGRVRVQSVTQSNGGPSYDSLSKVAREVREQQAKVRSRTWGARERSQFTGQPARARPALAMPDLQRQDGPQQAFLVRPADPNLPCSLCGRPLGPQPPLVAIPGLHLHFHLHCFACPVCHTFLAPPRGQNSTTVMVRSMRPHCHYCTSNTQGVQATEC